MDMVTSDQLASIANRIKYWGQIMAGMGQRQAHIAGGQTTISLIVGNSQSVTVAWPGGGFPTDQYAVETVAIAAGISAVTVTSQTATTCTVSVTAGLGLGVGAAFVLLGQYAPA